MTARLRHLAPALALAAAACGEIYPMAEGPRVELSPAELRVATSGGAA